MKKLLPILLAIIGIGGGIGAGLMLKPEPAPAELANPCGEDPNAPQTVEKEKPEEPEVGEDGIPLHEFVKLRNQFIIPVVEDDVVDALVVIAISLEVSTGSKEIVFTKEPKLRDAFLQVMFDHANLGGFGGNFTQSENMDILRRALNEVAASQLGDIFKDVLITDINRQDT